MSHVPRVDLDKTLRGASEPVDPVKPLMLWECAEPALVVNVWLCEALTPLLVRLMAWLCAVPALVFIDP